MKLGTNPEVEKFRDVRLLRKDVQLITDLAATAAAPADHVTSEDRGDADHRDGAHGNTLLAAADAALALMNVSR